jgi:hypothetical protein
MIYDQLYDDFISLFPEDVAFFRKREQETGVDREDGMTILFESVVCPFILKIAEEDPQKAQKAFDFVEKMEQCEDGDVASVADVSILEYIMTDERGGMKRLGKYLGKESLESVKHMSQYFNIDV